MRTKGKPFNKLRLVGMARESDMATIIKIILGALFCIQVILAFGALFRYVKSTVYTPYPRRRVILVGLSGIVFFATLACL